DDAVGIGAEKVETILGMNVASQISTSIDIAAATNAGTPIIAASPQHHSSSPFRNLSHMLAGEPATPTVTDQGRHAEAGDNDRFAKLFRIKRWHREQSRRTSRRCPTADGCGGRTPLGSSAARARGPGPGRLR